ncbi:MAG: metallophosphoesterase [Anaerocolumna sp.]
MSAFNHLTRVYKSAEELLIDEGSKIVLFSDCHRGEGNWGDNFFNNQNLYFAALSHYYDNGYIYIEIGDGDELWENRSMEDIKYTYSNIFWLLSKFYADNRFHMLYGNHDIVKKDKPFVKEYFELYYDESFKKYMPLFPGINMKEGLILRLKGSSQKIFLVHGHQVDFLNYTIWRIARFLVRYLWRPFELVGIRNPTSPAKSYDKKVKVELKLMDWAKNNNQMLIAGHTHRPVFPKIGDPLYFNDGSCVHPRCITAIEIENASISLVKWTIMVRKDRSLYVERAILEGPTLLDDYLVNRKK